MNELFSGTKITNQNRFLKAIEEEKKTRPLPSHSSSTSGGMESERGREIMESGLEEDS